MEIKLTSEQAVLIWLALIAKRQETERARDRATTRLERNSLLDEETAIRELIDIFDAIILKP